MSIGSIFNEYGYVKIEPKIGDKPYRSHRKAVAQAEIDLCTKCEKQKCKNGNCKQFKEMIRRLKEENNDV